MVAPGSEPEFRFRMSERLRHKGYGIEAWDCARLALEAEPSLMQAVVVPATDPATRREAPGHVWLVAVVDSTAKVLDPTMPAADPALLTRIEAALRGRMSSFATLRVTNPPYSRLTVEIEVVFTDEDTVEMLARRLDAALVAWLSPWTPAGAPRRPAVYYTAQAIAEYVRGLSYVSSVVALKVAEEAGGSPSGGWRCLTSAARHTVRPREARDATSFGFAPGVDLGSARAPRALVARLPGPRGRMPHEKRPSGPDIQPKALAGAGPQGGGGAEAVHEYDHLYRRMVSSAERMAHGRWSDFNHSDPGVTILEQLCYALAELHYRAGFPVRDLLAPPGHARERPERHALFSAAGIMPCNPVTEDDLRRIVLDRVPGVANVWFRRVTLPMRGPHDVDGLYDVSIVPLEVPHGSRGARDLAAEVARCYHRHRALCEDLRDVRCLRPEDVLVRATIELREGAEGAETMAEALFGLGELLSPEPKRASLGERLAAAKGPTEAYEGPPMRRGFIADDQLRPKPSSVTLQQIELTLAGTEGVLTVDGVSVEASLLDLEAEVLRIPGDRFLRLGGPEAPGGGPTLQLRRDGRPVSVDPARVRRLLDLRRAAHRGIRSLRADASERFTRPVLRGLELSAYTSIQTHFPAVYRLGPAGANFCSQLATRQIAQIKQLRAYLTVFDQLMADHCAQIDALRDLFCAEAGATDGAGTYAHQSLWSIVPDVGSIMSRDLYEGDEEGLAALHRAFDPVVTRRTAVADFLLSIHGRRPRPVGDGVRGLDAKRDMLRHLPHLGRNRGRGFDYRRARSRRNASVLESLSRLELGLSCPSADGDEPDLREAIFGSISDPAAPPIGLVVPRYLWPAIASRSLELPDFEDEAPSPVDEPSPLSGRRVPDALMWTSTERDSYRIARSEDGSVHVFCSDDGGDWWWLGRHDGDDRAAAFVRRLMEDMNLYYRAPAPEPAGLHVVEWTLLRHGASPRELAAHGAFRITAVASEEADGWDAAAWQRRVEEVVRAKAPAHVLLDLLFLAPGAMQLFGRLHRDLAGALRGGPGERLDRAARALAGFLRRRGMPPGAGPEPRWKAVKAAVGAIGLDCDAVLTAAEAEALAASGFAFMVRRVSGLEGPHADDLASEEVDRIVDAGLGVVASHRPAGLPGGEPATGGWDDGWAAAARARAAGLEGGTSLMLDLGGIADVPAPVGAIARYGKAWALAVGQGGYRPGLHVDRPDDGPVGRAAPSPFEVLLGVNDRPPGRAFPDRPRAASPRRAVRQGDELLWHARA